LAQESIEIKKKINCTKTYSLHIITRKSIKIKIKHVKILLDCVGVPSFPWLQPKIKHIEIIKSTYSSKAATKNQKNKKGIKIYFSRCGNLTAAKKT